MTDLANLEDLIHRFKQGQASLESVLGHIELISDSLSPAQIAEIRRLIEHLQFPPQVEWLLLNLLAVSKVVSPGRGGLEAEQTLLVSRPVAERPSLDQTMVRPAEKINSKAQVDPTGTQDTVIGIDELDQDAEATVLAKSRTKETTQPTFQDKSEKTASEPTSLLAVDSLSSSQSVATEHLTDIPQLKLPQEPEVGLILKNQFVLESVLGRGGMGIVFKARDLLMEEMKDRNPYVAIKVLRSEYRNDQMLLIALQREFKKAQKLSHPQIAQMMDFTRDEATGLVFVIMQYLEGDTLDRVIREKNPKGLPFKKAFPMIQSMGQAISYAHRQGIVHLDFKPANVFVCDNGDVKVLDFGISSAVGQSSSTEGDPTFFRVSDLGALTPAYASFEMLEAHGLGLAHSPEVRDDVYGFACVAYELLTGSHPFGRASATQAQKAGLTAKPPVSLSIRQARALIRGLAFRQADRTQSVDALISQLKPIQVKPILFAGLLIAAVLAFPVWKIQQDDLLESLCQSPNLSESDRQRIQDLGVVAGVHMDVGYLTSPPASNAALSYQEILRIDPCNIEAIEGMKRISAAVQQQAWEKHDQGDDQGALEVMEEALQYIPKDTEILTLMSRIQAPK